MNTRFDNTSSLGPALALALACAGLASAQGTSVQLLQETGTNDSKFGTSVAGLDGDIDGDGVPDFIVGAPGTAPSSTGAVYIVSGNGGLLRTHSGTQAGELYGNAVAGIGDQNLDGVPEYIVGVPFANSLTGKIEVRDGSSGSLIKSFYGVNPGDAWGGLVAGLGDLDGDGRGDYAFDATLSGNVKAVFVMSGMTNQILFAPITAPAGATSFPLWISSVGDLDGDGTGDIAVGAQPSCYVFSGASGALASTFGSGSMTASIGDVDGDGVVDLAAGNASFSTSSQTYLGQVLVYSGQTGAVLWSAQGEGDFDRLGFSLVSVSDVNRDGVRDLLVGAPESISGAFLGSGYARLYSGADGCTLGSFSGAQLNENFGAQVGNAADVDGDGYDDLLIGAYRYKTILEVGRVLVLKGQMTGAQVGQAFCYCASPGLGPCQNDATSAAGCKNSTAGDGLLQAFGSTSVSADDLFLLASGLPVGSLCITALGFSKANGGFGNPLGNGRICLSGPLYYLTPYPTSDASGSAIFGPCITHGSPDAIGVTTYFQTWYQDFGASSPCNANYNFTQALEITFTP